MPTLWGLLRISLFLLVAYIVGFNLRQMTYALRSIVSELQVFEKRVFLWFIDSRLTGMACSSGLGQGKKRPMREEMIAVSSISVHQGMLCRSRWPRLGVRSWSWR